MNSSSAATRRPCASSANISFVTTRGCSAALNSVRISSTESSDFAPLPVIEAQTASARARRSPPSSPETASKKAKRSIFNGTPFDGATSSPYGKARKSSEGFLARVVQLNAHLPQDRRDRIHPGKETS